MRDDWKLLGACRDLSPDMFYPGSFDYETVIQAKRVCAVCPVLAVCREVGLGEQHGVWGGMTERERRRERVLRGRRQVQHGTRSMYQTEIEQGLEPCLECRLANNQYQQAWRAS